MTSASCCGQGWGVSAHTLLFLPGVETLLELRGTWLPLKAPLALKGTLYKLRDTGS